MCYNGEYRPVGPIAALVVEFGKPVRNIALMQHFIVMREKFKVNHNQ